MSKSYWDYLYEIKKVYDSEGNKYFEKTKKC